MVTPLIGVVEGGEWMSARFKRRRLTVPSGWKAKVVMMDLAAYKNLDLRERVVDLGVLLLVLVFCCHV